MDTLKVKNYLQMQNFFAWVGFITPIAMIFFLMNFFPLPFSFKVINLIIYFLAPGFVSLVVLTSLFKGEIKSGADIKLLCWTFKIILYFILLFYFFTFIYSIVAEKEIATPISFIIPYGFMSYSVYISMYLLCFIFLILSIKVNSLLINSLKK